VSDKLNGYDALGNAPGEFAPYDNTMVGATVAAPPARAPAPTYAPAPGARIPRARTLQSPPRKPRLEATPLQYQPFGAYRFVLASLVVISHSAILGGAKFYSAIGPWGLGNIAVMVFFVLSGYIIAEALETFYSGRTLSFLANRALRIIPPYLAALVVSVGIHYWLQSTGKIAFIDYDTTPSGMFSDNNLVSNVLFVAWLYPLGGLSFKPAYLFVRYLWAVRVELHFYLVAAAVYAWRKGALLRLAFFLVTSWLALSFASGHGRWYYVMFAPHFLLGMSLRYVTNGYVIARFAAVISLILAVTHYSGYVGKNTQALVVAPTVIYAILALSVVGLALLRVGTRFRRIDRWLGDLSYPLYLNHYAITIAVVTLMPRRNVWTFLVCLPLSIAASWMISHLTEPVTRKMRNQIRGVALA